ncbi:hypothetical protein C475_18278 [Halosimplex carlsbadense 2-9-1]|uniref:Uncharacterized protein n=1 Tax=Halosimplex carlsbadense 2-9-1 TaxID=797114 RepID=M0CGV3_9EURY|nr:hypothetical protein [Halosimplex carlsbadense]ELZ22486.1 hypothetical protein C475_18278 [Halosimplex carlsbadense 2-9-1]
MFRTAVPPIIAAVGDADGATGSGPGAESPAVTVESVTVEGSRIESTVSYSDELRPFFDDSPFYVEYDVDVSDLPKSILAIPVLAHVCPVAWAVGADVRVPTVDRRFLSCLETVGAALYGMYPFVRGGRVVAESAPETERSTVDGETGMLFTGGVDSLATYARHREADPTLINVRGWLVGVDDDRSWAHTTRRIEEYGERFGAETQFVRSNMLEFLDTRQLDAEFKPHHDGAWYSAVGSGLGLAGLVAPLAVAEGMERLFIAASHWEGFPTPDRFEYWDGGAIPWGSDPAIDDEIAWTGTTVVHDGFSLTRQDRIEVVADFFDERDDDVPVRACEASAEASNCNRCEKCARTAFGLAMAGVDPNDHGFDVDAATFQRARREIEAGNWLVDHHHGVYWTEFARRVDPDRDYPVDGARGFANWLAETDIEAIADRSEPPAADRALRSVARATPYPVYKRLYSVYDSVKS